MSPDPFENVLTRARYLYDQPDMELPYLIQFLEWADRQFPGENYRVALEEARSLIK